MIEDVSVLGAGVSSAGGLRVVLDGSARFFDTAFSRNDVLVFVSRLPFEKLPVVDLFRLRLNIVGREIYRKNVLF